MERKIHNQRKSFKRQLKTKLSETANVGAFYPTPSLGSCTT